MFASSVLMAATSCSVTTGTAPRRTILLVLNETSPSFAGASDGTVVGIYVTSVKEMLSLCATRALIPYARDASSRQIFCVSEGTKGSVEHA